MPDDSEQQSGSPGLLTTAGQLAGIAREALVADTGAAKLAGLVREALIAGVGLAGRISAKSSAQGSVTTVFTGVTLSGTIAAMARMRAAAVFPLSLAGRITTTARPIAFIPQHITVAGRVKTMASARMLRLGQLAIAGSIGMQSKARGAVNLSLGIVRLQYGVTINTG
jgi:hypothetical protein